RARAAPAGGGDRRFRLPGRRSVAPARPPGPRWRLGPAVGPCPRVVSGSEEEGSYLLLRSHCTKSSVRERRWLPENPESGKTNCLTVTGRGIDRPRPSTCSKLSWDV